MRVVIASQMRTIRSSPPTIPTTTSAYVHVKPQHVDRLLANVHAFTYLSIAANADDSGACIVIGPAVGDITQVANTTVLGKHKSAEATVISSSYIKSSKDVGMRLDVAGAFVDEEARGTFFWG